MDEARFLVKCSIGIPEGQIDSAATTTTFRCHRARLEGILRERLDIGWEKCLKSVEMTPQGIAVYVENGPTIERDALVGADRVHSLLRKLFIPNSYLDILPYVVFNGRRIEDYHNGLQSHMAGQTIIQALHGNVLFRVYVNEYTATDVHLGYTYSRPARANDRLH